jgi:hypothetical protein
VTDLATLLAAPGLDATAFDPSSRYHGLPTRRITTADGRTVTIVARRFVPAPGNLAEPQGHRVREGDRADALAARLLGDPSLWWRLADANAVLFADELTEQAGRRLRVTLPVGTPGGGDDDG